MQHCNKARSHTWLIQEVAAITAKRRKALVEHVQLFCRVLSVQLWLPPVALMPLLSAATTRERFLRLLLEGPFCLHARKCQAGGFQQ